MAGSQGDGGSGFGLVKKISSAWSAVVRVTRSRAFTEFYERAAMMHAQLSGNPDFALPFSKLVRDVALRHFESLGPMKPTLARRVREAGRSTIERFKLGWLVSSTPFERTEAEFNRDVVELFRRVRDEVRSSSQFAVFLPFVDPEPEREQRFLDCVKHALVSNKRSSVASKIVGQMCTSTEDQYAIERRWKLRLLSRTPANVSALVGAIAGGSVVGGSTTQTVVAAILGGAFTGSIATSFMANREFNKTTKQFPTLIGLVQDTADALLTPYEDLTRKRWGKSGNPTGSLLDACDRYFTHSSYAVTSTTVETLRKYAQDLDSMLGSPGVRRIDRKAPLETLDQAAGNAARHLVRALECLMAFDDPRRIKYDLLDEALGELGRGAFPSLSESDCYELALHSCTALAVRLFEPDDPADSASEAA